MVQLLDYGFQLLLEDHEVHEHAVRADVTLQPEPHDVRVAVEPGALLVPRYEMACGIPDSRIASVDFQYHRNPFVSFLARAIESL